MDYRNLFISLQAAISDMKDAEDYFWSMRHPDCGDSGIREFIAAEINSATQASAMLDTISESLTERVRYLED